MTDPGLYRYHYREAVNGFFEIPTDRARTLLPAGMQPVELHHGRSILSITGFEFHDSAVGPYREVVLSILVPPRLVPGDPMPRAAMYPFLLGTSTAEARRHAIEVWHLPHYPNDLQIEYAKEDRQITLSASEDGRRILDLTIVDPGAPWLGVEHHYQTFSRDEGGSYLSLLAISGRFMENEEERGSLTLGDHPFTAALDPDDLSSTPFREQWMRDGVEVIQPLQRLAALARR